MSPVAYQPSASSASSVSGDRCSRRRDRDRVTDLARLARRDRASVEIDEAQLHSRQRAAVGEEPLLLGRGGKRHGGGGVLGGSVGASHHDAERRGPARDVGRNGRAAHRDLAHQLKVPVGVEVGMVEQAREEERRAASGREPVLEHRRQDDTGIPLVDHVERSPARQRAEHTGEPGDVAHRRTRELAVGDHLLAQPVARHERGELPHLGLQRAVGVHHPLRRRGGTRGVPDDDRRVGVDRRHRVERVRHPPSPGSRARRAGERAVVAVCVDHHDELEVGQIGEHALQIVEEVLAAESIRGDQHAARDSAEGCAPPPSRRRCARSGRVRLPGRGARRSTTRSPPSSASGKRPRRRCRRPAPGAPPRRRRPATATSPIEPS